MKNIRFLSLIITGVLFGGCSTWWSNTPTQTAEIQGVYWSEYYQTQCNTNPWGENSVENVTAYYANNHGVTILGVEFTEEAPDTINCNACGCPTGKTLKVQTNFEDRLALFELGFVHEGEVPDTTVTSATDVASDTVSAGVNTNLSEPDIATTGTSTDTKTSTTEPVVPVNDATTSTGDVPTEPTPEDVALEEKAQRVQQALSEYFSEHKNYPETLDGLGTDLGDTTGLNYTPIGSVPSSYYDLTVDYSTGKVTLNP